jgi:DHA1 family tetracycline resistance protein-like MFS transporter
VKSDELGELQGAADTLRSIANILGSILMSHIFAHFISKERVLAIPGMTFFISSILSFLSVLVYQFTLHSQFYRDDMVSSEMKLVANELN